MSAGYPEVNTKQCASARLGLRPVRRRALTCFDNFPFPSHHRRRPLRDLAQQTLLIVTKRKPSASQTMSSHGSERSSRYDRSYAPHDGPRLTLARSIVFDGESGPNSVNDQRDTQYAARTSKSDGQGGGRTERVRLRLLWRCYPLPRLLTDGSGPATECWKISLHMWTRQKVVSRAR